MEFVPARESDTCSPAKPLGDADAAGVVWARFHGARPRRFALLRLHRLPALCLRRHFVGSLQMTPNNGGGRVITLQGFALPRHGGTNRQPRQCAIKSHPTRQSSMRTQQNAPRSGIAIDVVGDDARSNERGRCAEWAYSKGQPHTTPEHGRRKLFPAHAAISQLTALHAFCVCVLRKHRAPATLAVPLPSHRCTPPTSLLQSARFCFRFSAQCATQGELDSSPVLRVGYSKWAAPTLGRWAGFGWCVGDAALAEFVVASVA